jgi:spore germination cell wall hydrolase CwlJ-like protein
MISRQNWERLGDVLAVVVAILLASVIVALAQTSNDPPMAQAPPKPVKIELKRPRTLHLVAIPGTISQDSDSSDALKKLAAEQRCLAEVMYFEARGESEAGRRAVAEVILHRLAEGTHGHTICNVVYEGVGQTFCQFTFACDGSLLKPRVAEPWRVA